MFPLVRQSISVLLVEDSCTDAEYLTRSLYNDQSFEEERLQIDLADSLAGGLASLGSKKCDVLLLDLTLPDSRGIAGLLKIRQIHPDLPIIVLTGMDDRRLSLLSMKHGAQDYLVKGKHRSDSIRKSIRHAIERKNFETGMKRLAMLEQRETFIAMLAHDLRNPLIGCEKLLKMLLENKVGEVPQAQSELLAVMYRSIRALLQMITNVLDCYRLESGSEQIRLDNFDLSSLLHECLKEVRHIAESKRMSITLDFGLEIFAYGDTIAMRRVINNLLSNALKFTPTGGTITIKLKKLPDKVLLRITDSGIGIPTEKIEHLFERFFQTDSHDRARGLGIGLHICKNLMEAQNGTIRCQSKENEGTTFEVGLPTDSTGFISPVDEPEVEHEMSQVPQMSFGSFGVEDSAGVSG